MQRSLMLRLINEIGLNAGGSEDITNPDLRQMAKYL